MKIINLKTNKTSKEDVQIEFEDNCYVSTNFNAFPNDFIITDIDCDDAVFKFSSIDNLILALQELKKHI